MATLAKDENLHNDATVIATCSFKTARLKKAMSKQTDFFFLQNSMRLFT
jgi:hypothetical protein